MRKSKLPHKDFQRECESQHTFMRELARLLPLPLPL